MFRNINHNLWLLLAGSMLFVLFPAVQAQPGIYPNYYGPYAPNPIGQPEYCENMMSPGVFNVLWAHGPEEEWDWQYLDSPLDMKANTRYMLTYDEFGELSISESEDSSLTGMTVLCCRNEGPDELVLSLEKSGDMGSP